MQGRGLLLDLLLREGYISVISGEPGTGKTFLALKAAIEASKAGDKVVMYAFNEDSKTLEKRIKEVFKEEVKIEVREAITMAKEGAAHLTSDILLEATLGSTVIIDPIDALMADISSKQEYRTMIQTLYKTVKGSRGRLIIVSESSDPFLLTGYAADAYITLYEEIIEDRIYRYASIRKARDVKIERPYIPFSLHMGFNELSGELALRLKASMLEKLLEPGGRYIIEIDPSIPYRSVNEIKRTLTALYLSEGRGVIYYASLDESRDEITEVIRKYLKGKGLLKNLLIVMKRKEKIGEDITDYWNNFFKRRKEMARYLRRITKKAPISIFNLWFNNYIYSKIGDEYIELIQSMIRFDKEEGVVAIGITTSGVKVNRADEYLADGYFKVFQKHGTLFVYGEKPFTPIYAISLVREGGIEEVRYTPIV